MPAPYLIRRRTRPCASEAEADHLGLAWKTSSRLDPTAQQCFVQSRQDCYHLLQPEQTNGATFLFKVKSPVYISSERGELHRDSGVAIYTGNARAWQYDNFVRGDKLTIYLNEKRMEAADVCRAPCTMPDTGRPAQQRRFRICHCRCDELFRTKIARCTMKAMSIFGREPIV